MENGEKNLLNNGLGLHDGVELLDGLAIFGMASILIGGISAALGIIAGPDALDDED